MPFASFNTPAHLSKVNHPLRTLLLATLTTLALAACTQNQPVKQTSPASSSTQPQTSDRASPYNNNANETAAESLGTRWGDEIQSQVTNVDLRRNSYNPIAESIIRYADKNYAGQLVNNISLGAGQVSFSVIDEYQRPLPLYRDGQNYYLSAQDGQSYQLRYENNSGKTYEVVASVDGLDVLKGNTASRRNSGYVLSPYDTLVIEGFRKSQNAVASFTFSRPEDAYANHNTSGSINNTGVIGSVIYELSVPEQYQRPDRRYAPAPTAQPNAFPGD